MVYLLANISLFLIILLDLVIIEYLSLFVF